VAQFVVVLDVTIVAIALPEIRAELGFSRSGLQWVVSAYTLVFGSFLLLAGRMADLWGRRRIFVAGLALFSGASLACGLSPSPAALLAARAVQGLGAAAVSPSALSSLTAAFPEGEGRERALAAWTAAAAGGGAAGWVLGGVLTDALGWAWVFLVNVPVGALGAALAPRLVAETKDEGAPRRLDLAGALMATAGLTLLVYGLTRAEGTGLGSPTTAGALLASLLLLAAFVLVEYRARHPLVPLRVFRSRGFVGANLVAVWLTATTTPPMFLCTLHAQEVLGLAPAQAGLLFPPFNLSVVAGSLLGPRAARSLGRRGAMATGLLAVAGGALLLLGISPGGGYPSAMLPGFALMGAGLGAASVASTAAGTLAAAEGEQGLASGLLNSAAQVGTALGLAVVVPLSAARSAALSGGVGDPPAAALVGGYESGFLGAAALAAFGALSAFWLLPRDPDRRGEAPEHGPRDGLKDGGAQQGAYRAAPALLGHSGDEPGEGGTPRERAAHHRAEPRER